MTSPRSAHTATRLRSGKVLVVGGNGGGGPLATAEVYDPATGLWSLPADPEPIGAMASARADHTAIRLASGKVLVVGGDSGSGTLPTAEVYAPPDNTPVPSDDDACDGQASEAPCCAPGSTPACYSGPSGTREVGLCKAGTQTCTASGMTSGDCAGEVLPQPESCTTAGDDDCDGVANEGDVCLCAPNTTGPCYTGPAGTQGVGVCQAGTGTCNASGTGWLSCSGQVTPQAESCSNILDDNCDGQVNENPPCVWSTTGAMAERRQEHTATLLPNGKVLVVGGFNGTSALNTAELYDPATHTWSPAKPMASPRRRHTATLLPNGKVLIVGGRSGSSTLKTAELYDPNTDRENGGTWTSIASMNNAREEHTATLLPDSKVLVAAGREGNFILKTAEVYDPGTPSWTATANAMPQEREGHTATLFPDGKVLLVGGEFYVTFFLFHHTSAEAYDSGTNHWLDNPRPQGMAKERSRHTATLLPNGRLLVTGGYNGSYSDASSSALYNPASGTWPPADDRTMNQGRAWHTATLLADGKVLIVGGYHSDDGYLSQAELYDSGTNTWLVGTSNMAERRRQHTATLLPNGKVLIVGGSNGTGVLKTAEVYAP
jgi:hypothetical protein